MDAGEMHVCLFVSTAIASVHCLGFVLVIPLMNLPYFVNTVLTACVNEFESNHHFYFYYLSV